MAATYLGPLGNWQMTRDKDGHRDYKLTSKVLVAYGEGPAVALNCPGLPQPGDSWQVLSDTDEWAYCKWDATVKPFQDNDEKTSVFIVEQVFTTKPPETDSCVNQQIDNPLLQPTRISGGSVRFQEEATHDRFGYPLINSAFEQIRGPQVEFDKNRHSVRIEQNVPVLEFALCNSMVDTVNDRPLWGLPRRCVKLSKFDWEAKYYGQCLKYYVRKFDFDTSYRIDPVSGIVRSGFDREVLDEGNKALHGQWNRTTGDWDLIQINGKDPNPLNPAHFDQFKDKNGENCHVILDGAGRPYQPGFDTDARWWCLVGMKVDAATVPETIAYDTICLNATCRDAYSRLDQLNAQSGFIYSLFGPMKDQDNCNDNCFEDNFAAEFSAENGPMIGMKPSSAHCSSPGYRHIEYYTESNMLLLGIPLDF